jgi:hypothetical protein
MIESAFSRSVTVVIRRGLRSRQYPRISKTRKTENVYVPVGFLSDAPREALICSPQSQNGETARQLLPWPRIRY